MYTKDQVARIVSALSTGVSRASTRAGLYSGLSADAAEYYRTVDAMFAAAKRDPAAFLAAIPGAVPVTANVSQSSGASSWAAAFAKAAAEPPPER